MNEDDSAESSEQLGPYRLVARIGEGGMGVVHLGLDPDRRTVAVKVLRPQVAADEVSRVRLAREVDTMRRVASPHVAEVLDADVHGERPYIVTRYVQGRTLAEVVATDGPLGGVRLTRLATGLADALAAIHAAGVVHRDVKPGNVVLVDGEPVVIDFGVAQAADAAKLTQTGAFIGTPAYLAPEVIEGERPDAAADVHGWAAVVAFAATGRSPFGSGSLEGILNNIAQRRADLSGVPEPLGELVRAALARDPAARPHATSLRDRVAGQHERAEEADAAAESAAPGRPDARAPATAGAGDVAPAGAVPAGFWWRRGHAHGGEGDPARAVSGRSAPPRPDAPVDPPPAGSPAGAPQTHPPQTRPYSGHPDPYAGRRPGTRPYPEHGDPHARGGAPPTAPLRPPTPAEWAGAYDGYARDGEYRPEVSERQPQPPAPRRRPLVGWLLVTLTAGFVAVAPALGLVVVALTLVSLRTADGVLAGLAARRSRRGPRDVDAALSIAGLPWHACRAAVVTVVQLLVPLLTGIAVALVLSLGRPDIPGGAVALAGCAFVLLAAFGPGARKPRQRAERALVGALRGRAAAVVTGVVAVLLIMVELSAIESKVLIWWPFEFGGSLSGW